MRLSAYFFFKYIHAVTVWHCTLLLLLLSLSLPLLRSCTWSWASNKRKFNRSKRIFHSIVTHISLFSLSLRLQLYMALVELSWLGLAWLESYKFKYVHDVSIVACTHVAAITAVSLYTQSSAYAKQSNQESKKWKTENKVAAAAANKTQCKQRLPKSVSRYFFYFFYFYASYEGRFVCSRLQAQLSSTTAMAAVTVALW